MGATHPKPKCGTPFILREIPASMIQRNAHISKGARHLWLVMRSMADHRTGELRHRDYWFSGAEIDVRAETSDETRKKYMRELIDVGLADMERVRVERVVPDRLTGRRRRRIVLGETHYTVFKSPHKDRRSSTAKQLAHRKTPESMRVPPSYSSGGVLLEPNSSTVQEFGPQVLSEIHHSAPSIVTASGQSVLPEEKKNHHHHPTPEQPKADDDSGFEPRERIENLIDRATKALVSEGHDPEFVELALARIDERSRDAGAMPGSPAYYVTAFRTFLENKRECDEVTDDLIRRRNLRKKYLGTSDLTTLALSSEQEERRQEFNAAIANKQRAV